MIVFEVVLKELSAEARTLLMMGGTGIYISFVDLICVNNIGLDQNLNVHGWVPDHILHSVDRYLDQPCKL